jgi:hypothetical protein
MDILYLVGRREYFSQAIGLNGSQHSSDLPTLYPHGETKSSRVESKHLHVCVCIASYRVNRLNVVDVVDVVVVVVVVVIV